MNKKTLAASAGINKEWLSCILSGKKIPSWKVATRLAALTGTQPSAWMSGDPAPLKKAADRLKQLGKLAHIAEIPEPRLLELITTGKPMDPSESSRLASAAGINQELWAGLPIMAAVELAAKTVAEKYFFYSPATIALFKTLL